MSSSRGGDFHYRVISEWSSKYVTSTLRVIFSYLAQISAFGDSIIWHWSAKGRPLINIYLISLSVFRKMDGHFNWLYYHNYLTGTFSHWWMTSLIGRRNWETLLLQRLINTVGVAKLIPFYSCCKLTPKQHIISIQSWYIWTGEVMDRRLDINRGLVD